PTFRCATFGWRVHSESSRGSPSSVDLLQRQRLFGLLYSGEQPSERAVDRLDQIPDFDKRLGLRSAVLAYESVEPNARDMLPALVDDLEYLRVERHDSGRHMRTS